MVAAAVVLGGGLGEATAVATSASSGSITVEVTVSAPPTEGPLIAHFLLPAGAGPRLALDPGPDRAWTGSVEVRRADWRVVFEDVSTGALSQAVSLTELGVAPEALVPEGLVIPPAGEGPSPLWLVVAAASSAAAAVLLAGSRGVNPRHLRRRPRRRRSATN
jgi:hypothetical protein